jgi:hypothetical protein
MTRYLLLTLFALGCAGERASVPPQSAAAPTTSSTPEIHTARKPGPDTSAPTPARTEDAAVLAVSRCVASWSKTVKNRVVFRVADEPTTDAPRWRVRVGENVGDHESFVDTCEVQSATGSVTCKVLGCS